MSRISSLVAAALLPAAPPLLLGTAVSTVALLASQAPAQAQSAEAVAKVAQDITVRIEGASQGSGVLVTREGDRYTVLTAWHVVSGQKPGEELDVYTPDGQRHQLEQGSIQRLGGVDMAVLTVKSSNSYELAQLGDSKGLSMGSQIYVAGFPLPSSAVPTRILRFLKGDVIANAKALIPNGYQLLYSNPTLPGMSGGAVLNAQGQLVGIHGQAETDSKLSEQEGVAVKTGTNQAIPITYFSQKAASPNSPRTPGPASIGADDYLARAVDLWARELEDTPSSDNSLSTTNKRAEVASLLEKSLNLNAQNPGALALMAKAKASLGDWPGALLNANSALAISPQNTDALFARARYFNQSGNLLQALADYKEITKQSPDYASAYFNMGNIQFALQDFRGACQAYKKYSSFFRSSVPSWVLRLSPSYVFVSEGDWAKCRASGFI